MHAPLRGARPTVFGRFLREPLVHFLLLGLLLFLLYGLVGTRGGDREIRVDDKVAQALADQFEMTRQRPPTAAEMQLLLDSYIRDEIFYREGVALGLDRDDPTIKRRVSQKFAAIAEESELARAPTDADLQRWLDKNANVYAQPSLVSFDQVMLEPSSPDIGSVRRALVAGADPNAVGIGRMLLPHFELYPADLIDRDFGNGFAKALLAVPRGSWEGPIRSGYGVHLVRVEKVVPGRLPELASVRAAVLRDYEQDRRNRAAEAAFRKLKRSYSIEYSPALRPAETR